MEGYQLRQAERLNEIAISAWWHQAVKATKGTAKNPRPVFSKLEDLYDYDARVDQICGAYEPDYVPTSNHTHKSDAGQIMAKRMAEFKKIKEGRKQNE